MAIAKLRKYELIYIIQPEATEEERERVNARVTEVLDKGEAVVLKREEWGKRKLAYEIRKFNKGVYYYVVFASKPGLSQEVERNLRMLDNCMRFQTIKLDDAVTREVMEAERDEHAASVAAAASAKAAEAAARAELAAAREEKAKEETSDA